MPRKKLETGSPMSGRWYSVSMRRSRGFEAAVKEDPDAEIFSAVTYGTWFGPRDENADEDGFGGRGRPPAVTSQGRAPAFVKAGRRRGSQFRKSSGSSSMKGCT